VNSQKKINFPFFWKLKNIRSNEKDAAKIIMYDRQISLAESLLQESNRNSSSNKNSSSKVNIHFNIFYSIKLD
jgi:hypothetical protein